MMTSTVKSSKRARGFSLLEIVIALVIASIVIGGAAGMLTYSSDEQALKKAAGEMEVMAKRARASAIVQQTPYAIEFRDGMVRMMPWAQTGGDANQDVEGETWELSLDNGMRASVRRWNSETWHAVDGGEGQVWRFDPNGLCEPISVMLQLEDSQAVVEFHPLTGAIRQAEYDMR